MKNLNSKLFEKSFDLKKINGGKALGSTYTECSITTSGGGGCGDVRNTTTTDNGTVISDSTTNNPCPA